MLCTNPETANQGEHEKKVTTFTGTLVEMYWHFWQVYGDIEQAKPHTALQKKFLGFVKPMGGSNMEAWHSIMDSIKFQMDETFQEALSMFSPHIMDPFAIIKQKHYMYCCFGLPRKMTSHFFWMHFHDTNGLNKYLLGEGNILTEDKLKNILFHVMPS